ncbi:MAG: glycosyltransferase, partial [Chloroflexi bacterium]|nr:glycosyltransferase [Chloroflexota bacterium]
GQVLISEFTLARHLSWTAQRLVFRRTWDAWRLGYVERALRSRGIQAVLAEYGPMGVAMAPACVRARIPLVVFFHGYDAYRQQVLADMGDRYVQLFEVCQALVVNTQSIADRLVALGAPAAKIHKAPCGVETSAFTPTRPDRNGPVFVAVGRFVEKKAPYLTLLAFQRVHRAIPDARLVVAGAGPLLEVCVRLAHYYSLEDAVSFPGLCSPAQVARLMSGARAFVQHSITALDGDSESLGVVFLEAGASGLPVIATRHDGIPEVVLEGETGLLVDEGDVDGMARAMIRLAEDPELAARMGAAGRARIEAEFSMDRSIANLWKIIENAIEEYDR